MTATGVAGTTLGLALRDPEPTVMAFTTMIAVAMLGLGPEPE